MQFHIRVLESAPDIVALLLAGLEYLINISYVDDTEVFKVCKLWLPVLLLLIQLYIAFSPYNTLMLFIRHMKSDVFCFRVE